MKPADLAALETELIGKLAGPLTESFIQGKDDTAKLLKDLQTQQSALREQAKTQLAEKRDKDREQNQTALEQLRGKLSESEQAIGNLQSEVEQNAPANAEKVKNLTQQMKELNEQQHNLRGNVMNSAQAHAYGVYGGNTGQSERNRQEVKQKLADYTQQLAQLNATTNEQHTKLRSLREEVTRLRSAEQNMVVKSQELAKPVSETPPTAIDGKLSALNTYAGIDLNGEKQLILDSYAR